MKHFIALSLVLASQLSLAQKIKEKRTKAQMLIRVELLLGKVTIARDQLKNQRVEEACKIVDDILAMYPEHLEDMGRRLNPYKKKVNKATNRSLEELIQLEVLSSTCAKGSEAEYVDPKIMNRDLKDLEKTLKNQRDLIEDHRTNFNNSIRYKYEVWN